MRVSFRAFVGLALPVVLVLLAPLAFSGRDASAASAEFTSIEAVLTAATSTTTTTSTSTTTTAPATTTSTAPATSTTVAMTTTTSTPEAPTSTVATDTTTTTTTQTVTTSTTAQARRASAPVHLIPSWFARADRPSGSCLTPSGDQRLGYTETFFGQGFCASVGHGAETDLYVFTHEIFHAATAITDETVIDCLTEIHLGTELPSAAYGCPSPDRYLALYETIMSGNYPRPERAVCIGELTPHPTHNVWICRGELAPN